MSTLVNANISSSLVRENVQGPVGDIVFRRTDLLNFLRAQGAVRPWSGGFPTQWNLVTAANGSAQVYAESEAVPVAGKQTYGRASLSPFFVRIACSYSGHVATQVKLGGVYEDPIKSELDRGTADLMKKLEDTLVGTTQDQGIQSIIDGGDTYASIAPGSVTSWKALESAVSGALTFAVLEDNIETAALTPYLSQPTHWLAPFNQITNYVRLAGSSATTSLMRFAPPSAGGSADLGMTPGGLLQGQVAWNGMPWVGISGLTSTVILGLDMNSPIELLVAQDLEVQEMGRTSADMTFTINFACALKVHERNKHIKLTGVTA